MRGELHNPLDQAFRFFAVFQFDAAFPRDSCPRNISPDIGQKRARNPLPVDFDEIFVVKNHLFSIENIAPRIVIGMNEYLASRLAGLFDGFTPQIIRAKSGGAKHSLRIIDSKTRRLLIEGGARYFRRESFRKLPFRLFMRFIAQAGGDLFLHRSPIPIGVRRIRIFQIKPIRRIITALDKHSAHLKFLGIFGVGVDVIRRAEDLASRGFKAGRSGRRVGDKRNEVFAPENLVHDDFQIRPLVAVERNPNAAIFGQHFAKKFEWRPHHFQPLGMLQVVIVIIERAASVKRRININAFDRPGVMRHKRFQGAQIVALDQKIFAV